MPTITIIGIGRLGGSIATALKRCDYTITNLVGRVADPERGILALDSVETIESDIVIIATNDDEIRNVATAISTKIQNSPVVLHLSGSRSSADLQVLSAIGCAVGSMHPLASISSVDSGPERLKGAYFCIEGDPRALDVASKLVACLGGNDFTIPTASKTLYHAAAVTASGHVTALIDLAEQMMRSAGIDADNSHRILTPLIQSTIANIANQGTAAALTGPFARADISVFERQIESISSNLDIDEAAIYFDLAHRSLRLARSNGVSEERISKLETMIDIAKSALEK